VHHSGPTWAIFNVSVPQPFRVQAWPAIPPAVQFPTFHTYLRPAIARGSPDWLQSRIYRDREAILKFY
jgi:hypothetical protein